MSLLGCGGGGGSSAAAPTALSPSSQAPVNSVTISGKLTYDRVPHAGNAGLDYTNTVQLPIRGVVVDAVDANGEIMTSTVSNDDGDYRLNLNANTEVRLQVRAKLMSVAAASWDVEVSDNTDGDALYVLQGSLASTGSTSQQSRDLHAPHGWTGQSYGGTRAAAPFAILDSVYTAIKRFVEIDPTIAFPALDIHWSTRNRTFFGDLSQGNIGSSAYHQDGDSGAIFILGQENVDTDEYDPHVIIHEWGHYFEHQMSRTDSIGGLHSLQDRLDPRVAFSEGFGNALSAIITDDPVYQDSFGQAQESKFSYDLESFETDKPGWFAEASIGAIIYDIYDSNVDADEDIAVGLGPLYSVMRNDAYRQSPVFATIFAFADGLRAEGSIPSTDLEALLETHSISGNDANGNGELNNGAIRSALPVYKEITPNGEIVQFCSLDDAGVFNKLGNRDFTFMTLSEEADITISVEKISGLDARNPDFNIWQAGTLIHRAANTSENQDSFQGHLEAGDYIIEAFDNFNIAGTFSQRGDSCYNLSVQGF